MGCGRSAYAPEVNLNFSSPSAPTPDSPEEKLHTELSTFFQERKTLLTNIEEYKGCKELVRGAMQTPTVELERQAFEGLLGAVNSIESFRVCSKFIERMSGLIFQQLLSPEEKKKSSSTTGSESSLTLFQTLTMDLAEIFNFVSQFDQLRLATPDLPNDFAFYRRLLPKFPKHPSIVIKDDLVADMAMFSADHSPMTNALFKGARTLLEQNSSLRLAFRDLVSSLANSCLRSLMNRSTTSALESKVFIARCMVISIILYDQIENQVFARDSPIRTRECILALKSQLTESEAAPLLRTVRYYSISYQSAPDPTQALLDDV